MRTSLPKIVALTLTAVTSILVIVILARSDPAPQPIFHQVTPAQMEAKRNMMKERRNEQRRDRQQVSALPWVVF